MQYSGHIEQGKVVLDGAPSLPDGARVRVELLETEIGVDLHPDIKRLAGLLPEGIDFDQLRLESILEKHS